MAARTPLFVQFRLYAKRVMIGWEARVKTFIQKRMGRFADGPDAVLDLATDLKRELKDFGVDVEIDAKGVEETFDSWYADATESGPAPRTGPPWRPWEKPMIDIAAPPNVPGDCLLAFAIPTTEKTFVRDLTLGHRKDFASHAIGRVAASTEAEGRERLLGSAFSKKLIPLIDQVCREVAVRGVQVVRDVPLAGPSGFGSLLRSSRPVVTLITHFRPSELDALDLLDADRLAETIWSGSDPLSAGLRGLLPAKTGWDRPMGAKARERLADALNRAIRSASLRPDGVGPPPPGLVVSPEELAFLNREVLDAAYAGLIRPGNLVEFADGLHRYDDVVRQIPVRAGAILDLTICNSNLLSDRIKDSRREWQVMSNEDPATLDFRLIFYKYRIKRLAAAADRLHRRGPRAAAEAGGAGVPRAAGGGVGAGSYLRSPDSDNAEWPRGVVAAPCDDLYRPSTVPRRTRTMQSLEDLIRESEGSTVTLGGPNKMEDLARRLRDLSRRNDMYFRACIAILVVVLLASLGFVILFRSQPAVIAGIFTAMGASAYGGVRQMVKLWREKVATDVAIEMVEVLPRADALKLLQDIFLKNAN